MLLGRSEARNSCGQRSWLRWDRRRAGKGAGGRGCRELLSIVSVCCLSRFWHVCSPLDLSSFVHSPSNSTTSSGSTLVRTQASDHCGFLLTMGGGATFFFAVASLPLKTREKKGMVYLGVPMRKIDKYQGFGLLFISQYFQFRVSLRYVWQAHTNTQSLHADASRARRESYGRAVMMK